jgi:hypothetical protein
MYKFEAMVNKRITKQSPAVFLQKKSPARRKVEQDFFLEKTNLQFLKTKTQ